MMVLLDLLAAVSRRRDEADMNPGGVSDKLDNSQQLVQYIEQ
jgi:hypothetical protein